MPSPSRRRWLSIAVGLVFAQSVWILLSGIWTKEKLYSEEAVKIPLRGNANKQDSDGLIARDQCIMEGLDTFQVNQSHDRRKPKRQPSNLDAPSLEGHEECVRDLIKDGYSTNNLPPAKNPDVKIPFYLFPEGLPKASRTPSSAIAHMDGPGWHECWNEYRLNQRWHVKRMYGFFASAQLENHPWRVYDPSDALIFVGPWFDFQPISEGKKPISDECAMVFDPRPFGDIMREVFPRYQQFLRPENTLMLMGDFYGYESWHDEYHAMPKGPISSNLARWSFKISDPKAYRSTVHFNPVTASFWREGVRWVTKSREIFLNDIVNADRLYDPDCCDDREKNLHHNLTIADNTAWKNQRPVTFFYTGKSDSRCSYLIRRAIQSAFHVALRNGIDVPLQPFAWLDSQCVLRDEDILTTCTHPEEQDEIPSHMKTLQDFTDAWHTPSTQSVSLPTIMKTFTRHSESWTNRYIGFSDARLKKLFPMNIQTMNRDRAKMVLSPRGDTASSQRSYEGLYHGSVTFHDTTEDHFAWFVPLPRNVPWRLLGVWDDRGCSSTLSEELVLKSGRDDVKHQGALIPPLTPSGLAQRTKKILGTILGYTWTQDDLITWSSNMMDCLRPMDTLFNDPALDEVLNMMRSGIWSYRADVLWEVPGSRVAENLIFETARMMYRNMESKEFEDWSRFGLDSTTFEPEVPPSCLLGDGQTSYEDYYGYEPQSDSDAMARLGEVYQLDNEQRMWWWQC